MTDLLWHTASEDADANRSGERLMRAKVAVAGYWPFLSLAKSAAEFDHRLALVSDNIAQSVPSDLLDSVTGSLRDDFAKTSAGTPDDWRALQRKPRPETWEEEDDDHRAGDEAADRAWERRHEGRRFDPDYDDDYDTGWDRPEPHEYSDLGPHGDHDDAVSHAEKATRLYPNHGNESASAGWYHRGSKSAAWWNEGQRDDASHDDAGGDGSLWDHEEVGRGSDKGKAHHPAGWTADHDSQGAIKIGHEATPDAVYDMIPPTDHANPRDALHSWVDAGHGRWAEHNVPSVREHIRNLKQSAKGAAKFAFWHEGAGKWVTAAAADGPVGQGGNPYYFQNATPEGAANTWNTGQYPQHPTGGDPISPIGDMYQDMVPGPWADKGGWSTNDMHLMPGASNYAVNGAAPANPARNASRRQAAYPTGNSATQQGAINWGHPSEGGGLKWETTGPGPNGGGGTHFGIDRDTDEVHAVVHGHPDGDDVGGMLFRYPLGESHPNSESHRRESQHDTAEQAMRAADYHHDQGRAQRARMQGSRHQGADGWQDEGVQTGTSHNPYFFSGGEEGVQGGQDAQFPQQPGIYGNPDLPVRPEQASEPLENRADWYENLTPLPDMPQSGLGPATGSRHPFVSKSHHRVTDENPKVNDWGQGEGGHEEGKHIAPVHPKKKKRDKPQEDRGEEMHKHRASFSHHAMTMLANGDMLDALSQSGMAPAKGMDLNSPSASETAPPSAGADTNVPQDGGANSDMSNMGGARTGSMAVLAARMLGVGEGDTGTGSSPPAPPSMTGGPGSVAQPPMQPATPQTTPPAQTPGGAGSELGMESDGANVPQAPMPPMTGSYSRMAAELTQNVRSLDDPSGFGDEFMEHQITRSLDTRPRQSPEHRNINTPQKAGEPIPTVSSPGPGGEGEQQQEGGR